MQYEGTNNEYFVVLNITTSNHQLDRGNTDIIRDFNFLGEKNFRVPTKNDTALGDYLALQNRKSTLKAKEREVINLVVSQYNDCRYCQSAHTVLVPQELNNP